MFTIPANVTLVLDQNITLHGHNGNTAPIVIVNGGAFRMREGAMITGNVRTPDRDGGAGAVFIRSGSFEMTGGTISHNTASRNGGAVYVSNGTFTMNAGMISHNTANDGGGIYLYGWGNTPVFIFNGGTIANNSASNNGGGVWVGLGNINRSTFTMNGGSITHNTADNGGGLFQEYGTVNIRGGIITSNIARLYGGGVYLRTQGVLARLHFQKTGGTITGFSADPSNGNAVRDNDGELPRRGHAVWFRENRRKETTLAQRDNLSIIRAQFVGW
jgi:predicted outer membrane repeat protein